MLQQYNSMNKKHRQELIDAFCGIKDPKMMELFLNDLLTPAENEDVVKRLQIVKQLTRGISQREIAKNLKISIAKITRGSCALLDSKGGFKRVFEKYGKK